MSAVKRIGIFVLGLAVVLGVALAIGSAVDPTETDREPEHGGHAVEMEGERMEKETIEPHSEQAIAEAPAGLAISEDAYTLRLSPTSIRRGTAQELRFSVLGADGEAVTDFDRLHERRMHLIVVRRDGTGFRHLHPAMDEEGTWAMPLELGEAGVYRVFADFSVGAEQHTLAGDLFVSGGEFEARPFPAPAPVYSTGGYEVRLRAGEPPAGEPSSLTFAVGKDGEAVDDLDPYLGARGHLVALREGDLAFLHVHPEEGGGEHAHGHGGHSAEASSAALDEIAFAATFPTAGRYRLYLQFKHEGVVRTAQFTVVVPR